MSKNKKESSVLANYRKNPREIPREIIWDLEYSISKLKTRLLNFCKAKATLFNTRLEERGELKQIERESYEAEYTELKAKHHVRAIEKAKERGKQKAHGIKKSKPKLTTDQLETIKTRRKQLGRLGKNLSSLIDTSNQSKKKKTKTDLKEEIAKTKLEQELKDLKKKQQPKGVQVGINPVSTNGGYNALDNVLGLMGIQKKGKKK